MIQVFAVHLEKRGTQGSFIVVYTESKLPERWPSIPVLVLLVSVVPTLALVPLRPDEAIVAAAAARIMESPYPEVAFVGGMPVSTYPLYPFVVRIVAFGLGGLHVWSIRLPSMLALLGIMAGSMSLARRHAGDLSAAVAGVMIAAVPVSFAAAATGDGLTVTAVLIVAAWFAWYLYGRVEHRWRRAWAVSLLLTLLAALQVGLLAVVAFYLPLCFVRRPIRAWRRMATPAHFVLLAAVLIAFFAWTHFMPVRPLWSVRALARSVDGEQAASYLPGGRWFPLVSLALGMPWILFSWPAYCGAYRPLEKPSVLTGYLRTLILPSFLGLWALSAVPAQALLVVLCPLAILTGIHYPILIRRRHRGLWRIARLMRFLILLLGGLVTAAAVPVVLGVVSIAGIGPRYAAILIAASLTVLVTVGIVATRPETRSVWLNVTCAVAGTQLLLALVWLPVQAQRRPEPRQAAELRRQLPPDAMVYKLTPQLIPVRTFYLRRRVENILVPAALPADVEEVYVLGGARPPILETRTWTASSEPVHLDAELRPVFAWRAGRLEVAFEPSALSEPPPAERVVRMYRGVLRHGEGRP